MKLQRFYVENTVDVGTDNTLSNPDLVNQIRRVFRLHSGDKAIFFDGSGNDYVSEIVSLGKDELVFHVTDTVAVVTRAYRRVAIAMSLIKKDNVEWVIQKDTEIGVTEFIPIVSDRSEKKGFNMERARKIMIEACEQSGRGDIPKINEPISLSDFLGQEKRTIVAFHTDGQIGLKDISKTDDIVACIGPEGGWTDEEIKLFKEKGASIVKIDAPVLRAETAAIVAATLLLVK